MEGAPPRRFGPPAHDQRGRHRVVGALAAPRGLGVVAEYDRLKRVVESSGWSAVRPEMTLKASVPGPYTMAGRLEPNGQYPDRYALANALVPIVRAELEALVAAGCREITVDEPSMSCYAHREDTRRLVAVFNDTVEPIVGKCRLSTHLCFGNYKGRAVGPRRYAPMFPAFLDVRVDEMHLEMASREFAEIECIAEVARRMDVAVGVIDVKSYYVERPEDVADRIRLCLRHVPADRLSVAPDCGLSQTARWAARRKLANMVEGARMVRRELGL
jgi:5-methyltetrahydropteroyltriglutamate--homocysteine methyltransferase